MEKVTLPKEVAKDIEWIRKSVRPTNWDIIRMVMDVNELGHQALTKFGSTRFDDLLDALVNGYEVEQTPEDKAIQWAVRNEVIARGKSAHDVVMAIKKILSEGSENNG